VGFEYTFQELSTDGVNLFRCRVPYHLFISFIMKSSALQGLCKVFA